MRDEGGGKRGKFVIASSRRLRGNPAFLNFVFIVVIVIKASPWENIFEEAPPRMVVELSSESETEGVLKYPLFQRGKIAIAI